MLVLKHWRQLKRWKESKKLPIRDSNEFRNRQSSLSDQQVYKEDIYEQQVDNSTMNKYQQYYSENYNKGRNKFSMQRNFDQPSNFKSNT